MSNKKIIKLNIISILTLCVVFNGCKSVQKVKEYQNIDYSENDAVLREVDNIISLKETDSVKALWKCYLLMGNTENKDDYQFLYQDCIDKVKELYKNALDEKNYLDAKRFYSSIKACDNSFVLDLDKNEIEIDLLIKEKIEALQNNYDNTNKKVSSCIEGTVTVLVDKGIRVKNGKGFSDMSLGSGFFISKDGYIITNHHVIADCVDPTYEGYTKLYVKLAGDPDTKIPAKVIGYDSVVDLALLKVEVDAPYVFTLGSSLDLDVGDKVYAIGSPLGLERTLTSGIISATDRELFTAGKVFQIDAAVNNGNSGGPLIDERGRVQAIVFAGIIDYEGLNFAIPVEYLKNELPILYNGGKREQPWIGCFGKTRRLAGSAAKNQGLNVGYIMPGGSGCLSGISENDTIIEVNGNKITSLDDFQNFMMSQLCDSIINVVVEDEEGNLEDKKVYLERRPDNPGYEIYRRDIIGNAMYPMTGIAMVPTTENRKEYKITSILKGSSGDEYGFSEGDPVYFMGIDFTDRIFP